MSPSTRTSPFDSRIHTLSNTGPFGLLHAALAPLITSHIDSVAYKGRNIRGEIATACVERFGKGCTVLEVGCGSGTMTKELLSHGVKVTAVDTSSEMLSVAKLYAPGADYIRMNGVDAEGEYDSVICAFVFHEVPREAHEDLLSAFSEMGKETWIVDISPSYTPSPTMLEGEPFVEEYLSTFDETASRFLCKKRIDIVKGHARMWIF